MKKFVKIEKMGNFKWDCKCYNWEVKKNKKKKEWEVKKNCKKGKKNSCKKKKFDIFWKFKEDKKEISIVDVKKEEVVEKDKKEEDVFVLIFIFISIFDLDGEVEGDLESYFLKYCFVY